VARVDGRKGGGDSRKLNFVFGRKRKKRGFVFHRKVLDFLSAYMKERGVMYTKNIARTALKKGPLVEQGWREGLSRLILSGRTSRRERFRVGKRRKEKREMLKTTLKSERSISKEEKSSLLTRWPEKKTVKKAFFPYEASCT